MQTQKVKDVKVVGYALVTDCIATNDKGYVFLNPDAPLITRENQFEGIPLTNKIVQISTRPSLRLTFKDTRSIPKEPMRAKPGFIAINAFYFLGEKTAVARYKNGIYFTDLSSLAYGDSLRWWINSTQLQVLDDGTLRSNRPTCNTEIQTKQLKNFIEVRRHPDPKSLQVKVKNSWVKLTVE